MSPEDRAELYMDDDTTPVDVLEFLLARTMDPVRFRDGDVAVVNYHNAPLDTSALVEWADDADPGVYVVPYQVSGIWTFMAAALPPGLRYADYLAYRASGPEYADYANWYRTYSLPDEAFDADNEVRELLDAVYGAAMEVADDV